MTANNQYKFRISEKEDIVKKLKKIDIPLSPPIANLYTYFELPGKKEDAFASLRLIESKDKNYIDMKTRDEFRKWKKYRSSIGKPEQIKSILERMGCRTAGVFHKTRRSFENEYIRIDLDEIEKIGTFLEIKFDDINKKKVESLILSIGIDPETCDNRSLMEIYLEKSAKLDN